MKAARLLLGSCLLASGALAQEDPQKLHLACTRLTGDDVLEFSEITVDVSQAFATTGINDFSSLTVVKEDTVEFLLINKRTSEKHVLSRITGMNLISECRKDASDLDGRALTPEDIDSWCAGEWKQIGAQECKRIETQRQF
jgi:hypothetical protein